MKKGYFTRRGWFALTFGAVVPGWAGIGKTYAFQHDYVLGTSLDLTIRGTSEAEARAAESAVLLTVERLSKVLNTRDPESEISRLGPGGQSGDLRRVIEAYRFWEARTGGAIRAEVAGQINLDALGKAYIVDRAAEAAWAAAPRAGGITLDIGGDIRVFGDASLGIADPASPFDNAEPLMAVRIADRALATSGTYARGEHLLDARTGAVGIGAVAATVTAADCMSANALALALCVLPSEEGLRLLEEARDAEGMLVTRTGGVLRSSGFRRFEQPIARRVAYAGWASGSQVSISLTLVDPAAPAGGGGGGFGGRRGGGGFGRLKRPYVAVWAEDASGKVVRNITLWASKPRWLPELHTWWGKNGSAARQASSMARATRAAGQYNISWNGMTDSGEAAPAGVYRIWIETNREHGSHYQESVTIDCSGKPSSAVMKATPEFTDVKVTFGPVTGAV